MMKSREMRCNRGRIVGTVLGIAGCWVLLRTASAPPPELAGLGHGIFLLDRKPPFLR